MSDAAILLTRASGRLAAAGIENPRREARLLLAHVLEVGSNALLVSLPPISPAQAQTFEAHVARREAHEPVAYITGTREFWSLDFEVGPGVLIPRPDTETLIEEAIAAFPDRDAALTVLDLGTGSGCLAIAFLDEYPNARGIAVDTSAEALSWARRNLSRHDMSRRCSLHESQWTDGLEGRFDAIFSNPPYIERRDIETLDADVARFEPHAALDGGADGLDAYRALAPRIARHLNRDGRAFVELGAGQAAAVSDIFATSGLEIVRVAADLSGIPRCLMAALAV